MKWLSQVCDARLACLFTAAILATIALCGPAKAEQFTLVSGCSLWLDASSITGVSNGNSLSSWTATSGDSSTYTFTGGSPTYYSSAVNGKAAVYFDGNQMSSAFSLPATGNTIFAVVQQASGGGSNQAYFSGGPHTMQFGSLNSSSSDSPKNSFVAWVPGELESYGLTDSLNTNWNIHAYTIAGTDNKTDWSWYYNGTKTGTYYMTNTTNIEAYSTAYLGDNTWGDQWKGYTAEIIIFNRVLSTSEIATVDQYLSSKYGIATSDVPEPTSMALLLTGGIALVAYAWRKRR